MTREEAISQLQDAKDGYKEYLSNDVLDMAIKALEQEPRKGHWIVQPSNKEQGERDFIWWKCSECGQVIFSETLHDRLKFHAFCGKCGADMREVKE